MKRWTCEKCGVGGLAPEKPRKDDVRRYCLDCSKKSGRLVERTCPALDKKRTASKVQASEKAKTVRAKKRSERSAASMKLDARFIRTHPATGATVDLRKELPKVWKAARKVEPRLSETVPKLIASRGYGSYAYTHGSEIHLGQQADWMVLVHEVAHFIQARRGLARRSDGKRAVHDRDFYRGMKDLVERLVPGLQISFYEVSSWGYAVDAIIGRQVRKAGAAQAASVAR